MTQIRLTQDERRKKFKLDLKRLPSFWLGSMALNLAIHVFLNGCNFRCLLLENFEVLQRRAHVVTKGEQLIAQMSRTHLWLNWFSEYEIMHDEEESRLVVQRNIGWIWSDVSRKENEKVEIRNFAMHPQCVFVFFFNITKIDCLFLVIFHYVRHVGWDYHIVEHSHQRSSHFDELSCTTKSRQRLFATKPVSWQTFNRQFHHSPNDITRRGRIEMSRKFSAQAIEENESHFNDETFQLDLEICSAMT